jgi:hypothetical protein
MMERDRYVVQLVPAPAKGKDPYEGITEKATPKSDVL